MRYYLPLCFLLLVNCKSGTKEEGQKKANVILFLVDDLGWTDLSCYGSEFYQTPHIDQLAEEGVRFTDAYAACTVCSPSRASIMTGKYPATINTTDWIEGYSKPYSKYKAPDWTQHIQDSDTTLAEALKSKGYKTVHIGKWHLGEEEQYWPEHHGFDVNIAGWRKGAPNKVNKKGGYFSPYNNPRLADGPTGEYLTERLSQEAVNFIANNRDTPFFLNFWLYNVHTPLEAKTEKIEKYKSIVDKDALQSNPTYAAMVEHTDDAFGAVVGALKKAGIYENTIIIFSSDNGGLIGNRGDESKKPRVTSNFPLREGKGNIYEGGVRVPLIISWPKEINGGVSTDAMATSPDIYPTIMGLLGGTGTGQRNIDGENLSPFLLSGRKPERDAIFWHYPHYHIQGAIPYSAVRKGNWKLIDAYERDTLQLYNLKEDIGERHNLVSEHPEKANQLLALLNSWKKEVGAQDPIENPDHDRERELLWGKAKH